MYAIRSYYAEDYVHFFDTTEHDDNIPEHKCYCVCWCNDDYEGKDFSSAEKRRKAAVDYIKGNNIQGYLAFYEGQIIGWCNANTKADCLNRITSYNVCYTKLLRKGTYNKS